jgi:ubiquinone/menaquinone biosynthesis C-methylase UbiE
MRRHPAGTAFDRKALAGRTPPWATGIGSWKAALLLYQRYLVPAITTRWAEDLIDRARLRAGETVLDVACGTGVVTRLAAKATGDGHVTGLDVNAGMLAVARDVRSEGAPITWIEGSTLDLPFAAEAFDVVFCQLAPRAQEPRPSRGERL